MGNGVYAYNIGLLNPGAMGDVQFSATVISKPTLVTLTTEAVIESTLTSNLVLGTSFVSTTTTVSPNNIRWH